MIEAGIPNSFVVIITENVSTAKNWQGSSVYCHFSNVRPIRWFGVSLFSWSAMDRN